MCRFFGLPVYRRCDGNHNSHCHCIAMLDLWLHGAIRVRPVRVRPARLRSSRSVGARPATMSAARYQCIYVLLLATCISCSDSQQQGGSHPQPPPAAASNYSLPYTIYYNNGGNYYGPNMSYPSPSPRQFGFIADNAPHTVGTNTFDFSGHPTWPNLIRNGKDYAWSASCPAPGVKTETPLGPLCCAPGGCIAQHGNASAVAALTAQVVSTQVSPELHGNCVLDFEGWNSVVFGNQFGSCPSGPPQDPDDPPPPSNIQRNLSLALARVEFPHLNAAQLEAQAAEQYHTAATELLLTVLATARAMRPKCHWGYWGSVALCENKRPCVPPVRQNNRTTTLCVCRTACLGAALQYPRRLCMNRKTIHTAS